MNHSSHKPTQHRCGQSYGHPPASNQLHSRPPDSRNVNNRRPHLPPRRSRSDNVRPRDVGYSSASGSAADTGKCRTNGGNHGSPPPPPPPSLAPRRRPFPSRGGPPPKSPHGTDRIFPIPPPPPPPRDPRDRRSRPSPSADHAIASPRYPYSQPLTSPHHAAQPQHHSSSPSTPHSGPTPTPPDLRRTLVLTRVPAHLTYQGIMRHFLHIWNAPVQFVHVDRKAGEAYVKFSSTKDALAVFEAGTRGLDGLEAGLASEGVTVERLHYTNVIVTGETGPDGMDGGDRKRGWNHESTGRGMHSGQSPPLSRAPHHSSHLHSYPQPTNKMPRYSEDKSMHHARQHTTSSQEASQSPHIPSSGKPNNPQQKQQQQEEQIRWQEFQKEEEQWRHKRNAEYQDFLENQQRRTSQIQKLEQKRDLVTQQETMFAKQMTLHKKMLAMMKESGDKSKKMKEILCTQTKITELKKEIKSIVEELEKMKKEESENGVFVPSEKRPVFGSRSLDRRTTVLRVHGFGEDTTDTLEETLKDHFSSFGAVTNIVFESGNGKDSSQFALVYFANRNDAERAKLSDIKLNDSSLTCMWHYPSSLLPNSPNPEENTGITSEPDKEESKDFNSPSQANHSDDVHHCQNGNNNGVPEIEIAPPPKYDQEEDEHMIDYDYDEGDDDAQWK